MPIKQIFLSSTSRDLIKHRAAVIDSIERLDGYHCVRMENFGARDWDADSFCRAKVQECDLFIGVVGHLYGSCPAHSAQSYTEREFEAAIAANKPRLMFIAPEDFSFPANLIEADEARQKQREFRQRASTGRIRDTFTSPEDLAGRVVQAIHNWEVETFRRNVSTPDVDQTLALRALPPQPNFVHPYPLQTHFTGRCNERAMLTQWLTQSQPPARSAGILPDAIGTTAGRMPALLALIAMGGMGKSALTWAWLQRDVLGLPLPGYDDEPAEIADTCRLPEAARPSGVLWWSFYERDARFANFVNEALRYAGAGRFDPASLPSPYERVQALFNLLQQQRLLLVLDGFERELVAYAGLNAAYQGDAIDEQQPDHVRCCTDPLAAAFLQAIASVPMQSRVLLTSRLLPREVEGLAGCRPEELRALAPEDAVTFFQSQGIKCTRAEIEEACRPYGYHPLALRLLAGVIVRDPRLPRDIKAAQRHPVLQDLKGKAQHHVLQVAYEALAPKTRDLLSRLAAFRSPIAYATLAALKLFEKEEQLEHALEELRERGLLFFDAEAGLYDLHPVVRQYSYDRLADKAGVHTQLRDYFSTVPGPEKDKIQTLEDLTPVIELYHHTVRAGLYDEAWKVYSERLRIPLYYQFGEYELDLQLLAAIPLSHDGLPQLLLPTARTWALLYAAMCYERTGRGRLGLNVLDKAIRLNRKEKNEEGLASALIPHSMLCCDLGQLLMASNSAKDAVNIFDRVGDSNWRGISHRSQARVFMLCGNFDKASEEFAAASSAYGSSNIFSHGSSVLLAYQAQFYLWQNMPSQTLKLATRANELSQMGNFERESIVATWLLSLALLALSSEAKDGSNKFITEAETHLTEALTRCRRINLVELEPDILLAWAQWLRAKGEGQRAKKQAEEALAIADRCEYRLKQAEVHNFLAGLSLAENDRKTAQHHAATAYERAWCDGPPHCYKPALEQAERMLQQLGAALPKMP